MSVARPILEQISARLLIQGGWIIGTFHVPQSMNFVEFLDSADPFFKLTDVTIGPHAEPVEFFALRRDEVSLVVPTVDESELWLGEQQPTKHAVTCWLHSGEIVGTIDVEADLRVSDYLMQHRGFVTLRSCVGREKHSVVNGAQVTFVNAHCVVGVVDRHLM